MGIAKKNSKTYKVTAGFTIVELLIVVVVIAILAAITVVSYAGITNQAHDTAIKSDMRQFAQKLELWKLRSPQDRYPTTTADFQDGMDIKVSKGSYKTSVSNAALYCRTADGTDWALIAVSKSNTVWLKHGDREPIAYTGTVAVNAEKSLLSQTVVCPEVLPNGATTNNTWLYSGGAWNTWLN